MQISRNFDSDEWACKDGTPYPEAWIESRLRPHVVGVCQPIRDRVGAALAVISGFRTKAYNRRIGGARLSRHMQGDATDLRPPPGWTAKRLHDLILRMHRDGELPLLGGLGLYAGFVHVDTRPTTRLKRWRGKRTARQTEAAA